MFSFYSLKVSVLVRYMPDNAVLTSRREALYFDFFECDQNKSPGSFCYKAGTVLLRPLQSLEENCQGWICLTFSMWGQAEEQVSCHSLGPPVGEVVSGKSVA